MAEVSAAMSNEMNHQGAEPDVQVPDPDAEDPQQNVQHRWTWQGDDYGAAAVWQTVIQ